MFKSDASCVDDVLFDKGKVSHKTLHLTQTLVIYIAFHKNKQKNIY